MPGLMLDVEETVINTDTVPGSWGLQTSGEMETNHAKNYGCGEGCKE